MNLVSLIAPRVSCFGGIKSTQQQRWVGVLSSPLTPLGRKLLMSIYSCCVEILPEMKIIISGSETSEHSSKWEGRKWSSYAAAYGKSATG